MRHRLYLILSKRYPAILWTIFIFILLTLPGKILPKEDSFMPNLDKFIHVFLFGSFVFLWSMYYASKQEKGVHLRLLFIRILVIGCVYGIGMEYIQKYFIPNRNFDIYDIVADTLGAICGFLIVHFAAGRLRLP